MPFSVCWTFYDELRSLAGPFIDKGKTKPKKMSRLKFVWWCPSFVRDAERQKKTNEKELCGLFVGFQIGIDMFNIFMAFFMEHKQPVATRERVREVERAKRKRKKIVDKFLILLFTSIVDLYIFSVSLFLFLAGTPTQSNAVVFNSTCLPRVDWSILHSRSSRLTTTSTTTTKFNQRRAQLE